MKTILILITFSLVVMLSGCPGGRFFRGSSDLVSEAEELTDKGDIDGAIKIYREHIAYRLSRPQRPDWENPYLYCLTIGDLEFARGDLTRALEAYEEAERQGVEKQLVADRFRNVARDFEVRDELAQAVAVLQKYRDRDPLLMDGMLDRISKEIVRREEAGSK